VNYFNEKAREKNREALSRITKHGVPYRVAYPGPETLASAINIGKSHAYKAVARFRKLGLIDKDNRHTELGKRVDEVGKYVLKANDQPHSVYEIRRHGPTVKSEVKGREVSEIELIDRFGKDAVEVAVKSGVIGLSKVRYFRPMDRESVREMEIVHSDKVLVYLLVRSTFGGLSYEGRLIVPSTVLANDPASSKWYKRCGKSFSEAGVREELMEGGCTLSALLNPMFRLQYVKGTVGSVVMDTDELLMRFHRTPLKLY
jgi:hypothetical protein